MIISYFERLSELIKSLESLSLTQIMQLYLKVEHKFEPSYRKKTEKIFRQIFNL